MSYCSFKKWCAICKQRHNLDGCSSAPVFYNGPCTKLEQRLQAKLYKNNCMHHREPDSIPVELTDRPASNMLAY